MAIKINLSVNFNDIELTQNQKSAIEEAESKHMRKLGNDIGKILKIKVGETTEVIKSDW